jgi:cardiolipin synthase
VLERNQRYSRATTNEGINLQPGTQGPVELNQDGLSESQRGLIPGNKVTLLENGNDYFRSLDAAFNDARFEIHLETYIFKNDETGLRIAASLKRAARRGVKVRLLVDGYGSKDLPANMVQRLRADGVETHVFGPRISPWTLRRTRLRRMHRKIAVVDARIAFVGGINIVNDSDTTGDLAPRHDYAVAVEGPLVNVIHGASRRLWRMLTWRTYLKMKTPATVVPQSTFAGGSIRASFLMRDNFHHRRDIERAYIGAIKQAQYEVIIANAYFLPGFELRHSLIRTARRGVKVILLLQGEVEYLLAHHATRALYGTLLDAGVQIYEYQGGFLHAKVAVIDGHWATVGSSNLDPFSLVLSREANVIVEDQEFSSVLRESLGRTIETKGREVARQHWKQQSIGSALISWLSYGFLRLAIGLSGYPPERASRRGE